MYEYEKPAWARGFSVCGVDEAGRGPLAGDVYAAAVILPQGLEIDGVNDSKKLSAKKRELLFDVIQKEALSWCIATASVEEIDRVNILQATFLAMRRAVAGLTHSPDIILVDGNHDPQIPGEAMVHTVIGGDAKSASIAAASILAKVARDHYMEGLAKEYPEYQFEKHKGYGTALHYTLLREYGATPVHRLTFLKKLRQEEPM